MNKRVNIKELEPQAYQALFGLEKYISSANLDPILSEIIRIRASQINGCAFCVHLHTSEAKKLNISEQKLFALSTWKESPLFNQEERIVLQMTEEITKIAKKGLTQKTYQLASNTFDDTTIAKIIMLIGTINIWNRIAVATKMEHPIE
jgi:AhpD family alkylhydroperoxidase